MTITRRQLLALATALPLGRHAWAAAPGFPSKPITLVVPFPAGGQTDGVARLLARNLEAKLGQPVLVDNRPGANSLIGTNLVARAAPDGHTLLLNMTALVSNPIVLPSVNYDPFTEFSPVARIYEIAAIWATPQDTRRDLNDFIQRAKTAPQPLTFGTTGHASSSHYFGEMLARASGIALNHIPYKGETPMLPDLIGGRLHAGVISSAAALNYGRDGRIQPLAATGKRRWKALPDVPTFTELGIAGINQETFAGIFAPAATPPAIIQTLHEAITQIGQRPDYQEQMLIAGLEVAPTLTPAEFTQVMRKVQGEWTDIKKDSAIRIE